MKYEGNALPVDTVAASALTGVAASTLENWRSRGFGPKFLKIGRKVMYDPRDIEAWKDTRRVGSTSEVRCN